MLRYTFLFLQPFSKLNPLQPCQRVAAFQPRKKYHHRSLFYQLDIHVLSPSLPSIGQIPLFYDYPSHFSTTSKGKPNQQALPSVDPHSPLEPTQKPKGHLIDNTSHKPEIGHPDATEWKEKRYLPENEVINMDSTIHHGFILDEFPPPQDMLIRSKDLELQIQQDISDMVKATTVHEAKHLATCAKDNLLKSLQITGNHSRSPTLLFNLGLCYYILELWPHATETLLAAIEMEDDLIPAYKYVADCFQMQGLHAQAVWHYEEYFKRFPKYYGQILNQVNDQKNRLSSHTEALDQISRVNSEAILSDVVFRRGKSYFYMKELGHPFAGEDFKAVARLGGRWTSESFQWLGKIESRKCDHWKAIQWYTRAIETNPNNLSAYHDRAKSWDYLGKEKLSEEDMLKASFLKRKGLWEGKDNHQIRNSIPKFDIQPLLDSNYQNVEDTQPKY